MIIYGWRTLDLKKSPELGEPCTKCSSQNTRLAIIVSYFHIFWIPFFPYRKKYEVDCQNCNYQALPGELSNKSKLKAKQVKASVFPPIYMFSGLILLIATIIYFNI